jgi:phosphinothricin acetyltransferase
MLRVVCPEDAAEILEIYAPNILTKATSFEVEVPTLATMERRIVDTLAIYPWLVYATDEGVRGYAYAGQHRTREAYQWSVDVSVYIHEQGQRQGVGRALYSALFAVLRLQGFYNAYAGATLPNLGSVGLHEAMGFKPVGVYHQVGYKFGTWHDVIWWSLELQPKSPQPTLPIPFALARNNPGFAEALNEGAQLIRA